MKINKTDLKKYNTYKDLLSRWKALPKNFVAKVVDDSEVSIELLNRVRSERLHQYIKQQIRK